MDRVRFGRALGFGTRQAIKTLVNAADAATAPNPRVSTSKPASQSSSSYTSNGTLSQTTSTASRATSDTRAKVASSTAKAAAQTRELQRGLSRGGRRFGEAFWKPAARLSGVLWLELTGVFFGLFALFAFIAVLRLRDAWRLTSTNAAAHRSLLGAVAMMVVFGYFCLSSFIRARRRERQR